MKKKSKKKLPAKKAKKKIPSEKKESLKKDLSWQKDFIQRLKEFETPQLSLVDLMSDLFTIDTTSSYRRMRLETEFTMREALTLSKHFRIPLLSDHPFSSTDLIAKETIMSGDEQNFKNYLVETRSLLKHFASLKDFKGLYSNRDIPLLYYFHFPELAKFKMFFLLKTMKEKSDFANKTFNPDLISDEQFALCQELSVLYSQIPFAELWNEETVNSTLHQIEYYTDSGYLSTHYARLFCEQFTELIHMIESQCISGLKSHGKTNRTHPVPYHLYYNPTTSLDEMLAVEGENYNLILLTFNGMDYLYFKDEAFCTRTIKGLQRQINKAVLLNSNNEKERIRFFRKIYEKIEKVKGRVG